MEDEGLDVDSELKEWLMDEVGMKGKKLAICLKAFDEAVIEDLNDIRSVQRSAGGLRRRFCQWR
jgi:hypothetical protein